MGQDEFNNFNISFTNKEPSESDGLVRDLFRCITSSVAENMGFDLIIFNKDLKIIFYTPTASERLDMHDFVDKILSSGTEEKIGDHWANLFQNMLITGQKSEFRDVKYLKNEKESHLNFTGIPLYLNVHEIPIGGVLIVQDASALSDTENRPAYTERLIAMGKIAGQVAHELNNPLDGILRYINLSIRVLNDGRIEKAQDYLQQCRIGLRRMIQVLGGLLEFSRSTHLTYEKLPLDRLLLDALKTLEHSLNGIQVTVDRQYKGSALSVRTDSIFQVFCNLIKNAADAMNGSGSLTIIIEQIDSTWKVSFRDTGPGFDPAGTENLFQPFYTTKPYGHGTGLGLAICKDILEKFGGTITAVNNPEGGSIFSLTLPQESMNSPTGKPDHE